MSQFTKTPPTEPGWYWIDETVQVEGSVDASGRPITHTSRVIREVQRWGTMLMVCEVGGRECYGVDGQAAWLCGYHFAFGPRVLLPPEPIGIEAELADAGPLEVPEILTAAWILRLANEFDVTASDDMPDGERKFHTKFNTHLLGHIWDDMATLWANEGGPPVPPVPEIQPDTATPEADFAAALLAVHTWCDARAPIAPRQ